MLDLFYPPDAKKIVALAQPSRVHLLDGRHSPADAAKPDKPQKDKDAIPRRMQQRLKRQAEIVETLKTRTADGVLTLQQIIYHGGFHDGKGSKDALENDLDALRERGIVARQKVTNRAGREPRRVWAYWLVP